MKITRILFNSSKYQPVLLLVAMMGCSNIAADDRKTPGNVASAGEVFNELCKNAGEKIHRTVDNVDGVFLMKVRPATVNLSAKYEIYDPYGHDLGGDGYIQSFLKNRHLKDSWDSFASGPVAYSFVEAVDPVDKKLYRYTGQIRTTRLKDKNAPLIQKSLKLDPNFDMNIYSFVLDRTHISKRSARYGVDYQEISTRAQRDQWIAGSSLRIIDLETNEIIAERIGYIIDPGAGARAGGRTPWLVANKYACPSFGVNSLGHLHQAVNFTKKSLKPTADSK